MIEFSLGKTKEEFNSLNSCSSSSENSFFGTEVSIFILSIFYLE